MIVVPGPLPYPKWLPPPKSCEWLPMPKSCESLPLPESLGPDAKDVPLWRAKEGWPLTQDHILCVVKEACQQIKRNCEQAAADADWKMTNALCLEHPKPKWTLH